MENILDIFMLLNTNNDGYLDYEETKQLREVIMNLPEEKDRGIIKKEEDFSEIFWSYKKYNVDAFTFKDMIDKMNIDYVKVNEALYDREYHGVLNAICCRTFKCCCRMIRRKMVKAKIKEFDEDKLEKK